MSLPFVSVITPTFNRRPFIKTMFELFRQQTYPKQLIEWIIIDDGTDKIQDLVESSNIPQIRYFSLPKKLTLGKKRNCCHDQCRGDIIVYMDDDDYYPVDRISHAVNMLLKNPTALCAGASEIYTYYHETNRMIQFGPYGPTHATAGTFAFRKELLTMTSYNEEKAIGEEKEFLKDYSIPMVQLDPLKTILVFSHEQNTFDKRNLLQRPDPKYVRESTKTVDDFIKGHKDPIYNNEYFKNFYTRDVHPMLLMYEPGDPSMKPDVLRQIKEQQQKIAEMEKNQTVTIQVMGQKDPIVLSGQQIIDMMKTINEHQNAIKQLQEQKVLFNGANGIMALTHSDIAERFTMFQNRIANLEKIITEKDVIIQELQSRLVKIRRRNDK